MAFLFRNLQEGFVIENIISKFTNKWRYSYYRTTGKIEIDLVLETPNNELWAIEWLNP